MSLRLLFVDDDKQQLLLYRLLLGKWKFSQAIEAEFLNNISLAEKKILATDYDLIFLDLNFHGVEDAGIKLLRRLKPKKKNTIFHIISASATFQMAREVMQAGASDFISKAAATAEIPLSIEMVFHQKSLQSGAAAMLRHVDGEKEKYRMIGESAAMRSLRRHLEKFAVAEAPVLIEAETGSGKELVARNLHLQSNRAQGPFLALDCGAIPAELAESILFGHEKGSFTGADSLSIGLLEQARGGTLFLDELLSLPMRTQAKLLRALESQEIRRVGGKDLIATNFRLICAANEDVEKAIRAGQFRADLYYRLAVVTIHIPPLRSRKEDIADLAKHFAQPNLVNEEILQAFKGYSWPGNIRELRNAVSAIQVLAGKKCELEMSDMPDSLRVKILGLPQTLAQIDSGIVLNWRQYREKMEKEFLQIAYASCEGNVSKCARMVGMDRANLIGKLKRNGIHRPRAKRL